MNVKDFRRNLRLKIVALALPPLLRPSPYPGLIRIGSSYGGWWVPSRLLGADSIVYLAGAGEDITFDLGLIERFGCHVVSLDPTPRAIAHVGANAPETGYHFIPVGLGGSMRRERFYAPANPAHVSHSIENLQRSDTYFEAELRTLESLMEELGHDHLDLLKIDIEGAEYEVLDHILQTGNLPRILCVEFDQPVPVRRTLQCVSRLRAAGYRTVKVEAFNVTFVHEGLSLTDG